MYDLSSAPTGKTVGIKALYLAAFSGYRNFYLFGFDSSYRNEKSHAYPQLLKNKESVIDVKLPGIHYLDEQATFRSTSWMATQAGEFEEIAKSLASQGCRIVVRGDGLLPHVANLMLHVPKIITCVWDLQLCPPTYDFGAFLNECERARIAQDCEAIDMVIQPGPLNGFRNDELPPNLGARQGMLFRVVMAMARLLPSVRNIECLKARKEITGKNIFPENYLVNQPVAHYGHHYMQFAKPILQATVAAKLHVSKTHLSPYITITTREATHWAQRNSNMAEWRLVAKWIEARGYRVVWVPDSESVDANLYSFDLDMRLALYESAVVNLGINNGPTMILPYTNAKYLMFKMVTDGIPWTTREFHEKWGTKEGDQPGGRGRFIYESDDCDRIVRELKLFFKKQVSTMAA
jgi:hypothetical protein